MTLTIVLIGIGAALTFALIAKANKDNEED